MGEPAPNQLGQRDTRALVYKSSKGRLPGSHPPTDAPLQPFPETLNNLNNGECEGQGQGLGRATQAQPWEVSRASGLPQGSEVFEGSSPIAAGQVLVELLLEGLQAVPVGGAGAEAGDVRAWGVWQVDGKGLWQHQELILLWG